ncbi:hypothetical protein RN001_014342 [Aquatica leii]|uniref:Uncharacterized protein n=1 Tax=Aquatica leii TaxID=1421715 RepID=A0AAN7SCT6_9COLE|nr:hypothetical protein RN001_014342 [Aquatica leii]
MKLLLQSFMVASCFISIFSKPLSKECKCWDGYQPNDNGSECVGVLILHVMQCNIPQAPRCKCSGDVSGILSDKTGIWCTTYKSGKELKRWECENKTEWQKFFEKHPEYKP